MGRAASIAVLGVLLALAPAAHSSELPGPPGTSPNKVLVVGVDGTRWDVLRRLMDAGRLPHFDGLRRRGFATPHQLDYAPPEAFTMSQVGWASVATGVWPPKHHVTTATNDDPDQTTKGGYPDFLSRADAARPALSTMLVADWGNIGLPVSGGPIFPAADAKRVVDAHGKAAYEREDQAGVEAAARAIREVGPDLSFVYGSAVDDTAHEDGSETAVYEEALERTDARLGLLLDAIAARPQAPRERWTVIVVTDHGQQPFGFGSIASHGGPTELERTSWVIAAGPGVPRDPPPARVVDVAPTVLHQLALPVAAPSDLDGRSFVSAPPPPPPGDPFAHCRRTTRSVRCAVRAGAAAPALRQVAALAGGRRATAHAGGDGAARLRVVLPAPRRRVRLTVTDAAGWVTALRVQAAAPTRRSAPRDAANPSR